MTTLAMRSPWQGVRQIFQFNWRFYLSTAAGVVAALALLPLFPAALRGWALLALLPAIYWGLASLAISHYIYDLYPLYDLSWIADALPIAPRRWINFHSGLDETTDVLREVLPQTQGCVADIFDPRVMTEPSIHEARKRKANAIRAEHVHFDALPFASGSFDAAFALFAAHELRGHAERVQFFREVARILATEGAFILMEHARDAWNFLAFGPGFLHFFSPRAWRSAAAEAGFAIESEHTETPFIRVYVLRRLP